MTIFRIQDEPEITSVLNGIYPILNIEPETDIEKLLDWSMNLADVGIRLVQVRAKRIDKDALPQLLDEVVNDLRGAGLSVILNDYVEYVKLTGADGVHLGYEDYPVFEARAILGQKAIIGATVRNYGEALHASGQGASYIAAGSIYPSPTKGGLPVIGLNGLREIHKHIEEESMPRPGWGRFGHIPICVIGGISKDRLKEVHSAGASMVAVIGAIQNAEEPLKAASELAELWRQL